MKNEPSKNGGRLKESKKRYKFLVENPLKKKLEKRLKRTEKLASVGELAEVLAHKIRNPLNTLCSIADQLKTKKGETLKGDDISTDRRCQWANLVYVR